MRKSMFGALGALVAAGVLLPVGAAQAAPTGCSTSFPDQWSMSVTCSGGTGTVTAHVMCSDWYTGTDIHRNGQPVPPGQTSTAKCPQKVTVGMSDYWYTTAG
jgi:hypothetical protein